MLGRQPCFAALTCMQLQHCLLEQPVLIVPAESGVAACTGDTSSWAMGCSQMSLDQPSVLGAQEGGNMVTCKE